MIQGTISQHPFFEASSFEQAFTLFSNSFTFGMETHKKDSDFKDVQCSEIFTIGEIIQVLFAIGSDNLTLAVTLISKPEKISDIIFCFI